MHFNLLCLTSLLLSKISSHFPHFLSSTIRLCGMNSFGGIFPCFPLPPHIFISLRWASCLTNFFLHDANFFRSPTKQRNVLAASKFDSEHFSDDKLFSHSRVFSICRAWIPHCILSKWNRPFTQYSFSEPKWKYLKQKLEYIREGFRRKYWKKFGLWPNPPCPPPPWFFSGENFK